MDIEDVVNRVSGDPAFATRIADLGRPPDDDGDEDEEEESPEIVLYMVRFGAVLVSALETALERPITPREFVRATELLEDFLEDFWNVDNAGDLPS